MEFQSEIMEMSDDVLNGLFDETPSGTPSADSLVGGKKEAPKKEESEVKGSKKAPLASKEKSVEQPISEAFGRNDIQNIDLDSLDEEDEEEEVEEEEENPEAKKKPPVKRKEEASEESEEESEEEEKSDSSDVKGILKSTVEYLIQSGAWQDFEGREDLDIDEDTYAKLVAQQDSLRVSSMFEELVDSTGPFGKAIIEFVKNGGQPDEIIDLFKEQKQVEAIPLDSVDGQKELIKHYYSEVLGWKPERVEKQIGGLILSNELENEAKEVKDLLKSYYGKEADRLNKDQEDFVAKEKEKEKTFESNIRNTIKERKDLSLAEKRTVEDYLLSYDQRLPNGNLVNKFYVNFAKMQANPQDYVDLVMFVMDKQKFVNKVATQEKSKAAAEAFKFIKGNGAVSTKKGSQHEQSSRNKDKKVATLDWGLPSR